MRTHLHTTLNKSRDERTETAGEGRGTRRGDPAAVDVWLSDWLSVAKILRIPGIGSIPLLRDSIPPLRVSIPLLAALDVWLSDWLSVAKIWRIPGIGSIPPGIGEVVPLFGGSNPKWYHFGGTHPGIEPSRAKNGPESQSLNQTPGARG